MPDIRTIANYPIIHGIEDIFNPTGGERSRIIPGVARRISLGANSLMDELEVRPRGKDWLTLSKGRAIVGEFSGQVDFRAASDRLAGPAASADCRNYAEVEFSDVLEGRGPEHRAPFFFREIGHLYGAGTTSRTVGRVCGRTRAEILFRSNAVLSVDIGTGYADDPAGFISATVPLVTAGVVPVFPGYWTGWVLNDLADWIQYAVTTAGATVSVIVRAID